MFRPITAVQRYVSKSPPPPPSALWSTHPRQRLLLGDQRHGFASRSGKKRKRPIAVVLSGCGVFDGTEIHEAAATVVHLTRRNMEPKFYAPCLFQADVVDHSTGQTTREVRSMITESARIARGEVRPLHELRTCDVQAIVFPGGFGVAKNLSNFSTAAASCALNIDVCRIIQEFHRCRKPMAFMCISSILAARIIPNVRITLGSRGDGYGEDPENWPHREAITAVEEMGACHEVQDVTGIAIDTDNMILSTPAFMYQGGFHEIFAGIGKLIDHLECMLKLNEEEFEN